MEALALLKIVGAFLKRIPWQVWTAAALALCLWLLYAAGVHAGRAEVQARFDAYKGQVIGATAIARQRAEIKEAQDRTAFALIAKQYQEDVSHAKADARQLAADLHAGRQRLQQRWTCPAGVPGAAAGAAGIDEAAADRAESAGRIVGAADEADAQIRALQDILRAERKPLPE
jgi:hypothetical protein